MGSGLGLDEYVITPIEVYISLGLNTRCRAKHSHVSTRIPKSPNLATLLRRVIEKLFNVFTDRTFALFSLM